jgi:hypothetical protein
MAVAGFCDPHSKVDVTLDDAEMWEASAENAPDGLSLDQAKYCLELLKVDFDLIIQQERQVAVENISENATLSWKRVVQGVSETCDVCDATLFNLHWACPRCGFVVCLDCYVSRKSTLKNGQKDVLNAVNGETTTTMAAVVSSAKDDKDRFAWLLCTNKSGHDLEKLMLTQIVTGNALEDLTQKLDTCGVKFRALAEKKRAAAAAAGNSSGNKNNVNNGVNNGEINVAENGGSSGGKGASLRDLIGMLLIATLF